jgi:hypothetical protein
VTINEAIVVFGKLVAFNCAYIKSFFPTNELFETTFEAINAVKKEDDAIKCIQQRKKEIDSILQEKVFPMYKGIHQYLTTKVKEDNQKYVTYNSIQYSKYLQKLEISKSKKTIYKETSLKIEYNQNNLPAVIEDVYAMLKDFYKCHYKSVVANRINKTR